MSFTDLPSQTRDISFAMFPFPRNPLGNAWCPGIRGFGKRDDVVSTNFSYGLPRPAILAQSGFQPLDLRKKKLATIALCKLALLLPLKAHQDCLPVE